MLRPEHAVWTKDREDYAEEKRRRDEADFNAWKGKREMDGLKGSLPKVGLAQVTGGDGLEKMLGDWLTSKTAGAAGAAAAPAAGSAAGAGGAAGGLGGLGAMAGGAGGLGSVIPGLTMATMKGAGKAAHQANIPARAGDALADFGRKMQGLPGINRPDPTDKYGMFGFGLGQALAGIGGGGPAVSGNVDKPDPVSSLSSIVEREGKAGMGGSALAGLSAAGGEPATPGEMVGPPELMGPPERPRGMGGAAAPRKPQMESRVTAGPWINKTPQTFDEPGRPQFSQLPGGDIDLGSNKIGGEFNIDAGQGLGGAVRKGQMQSAIEKGDNAMDAAALLAALGGGAKVLGPAVKEAAAPDLAKLGWNARYGMQRLRNLRGGGPAMPARTPAAAPPSGAPSAAPPASTSGGSKWWETPLTPQQRADWGAGQFGSRANTVPAGTVPARGPMGGGGGSMSVSPSAQTGTIPAGPPAMTNVPWTMPNAGVAPPPSMPLQSGVGTIPMGAAPTVVSDTLRNNPELLAAAIRSGAIPKLMGESVEAAVARILGGG